MIEQFGSGVQTILPFCCAGGFRVVTKILGGESNSEGFFFGSIFLPFSFESSGGPHS